MFIRNLLFIIQVIDNRINKFSIGYFYFNLQNKFLKLSILSAFI